MMVFVDQYRENYGVEPICRVLRIAPSGYWRYAAEKINPALRCAKRDKRLMPDIQRVWHASMQVYGAKKVWRQLNREAVTVA